MADLVELLRGYADDPMWADHAEIPKELLREAVAALEAEASEGERRGLERAAEVIEGLISEWSAGPRSTWAEGYEEAVNDAASAVRALITEAPVRDGWQPISSAPKDRTRVIIAVPSNDPSGFVVGEAYRDKLEGGWWWANLSYDDYAYPIRETPTHWRPLPSPPQDNRED